MKCDSDVCWMWSHKCSWDTANVSILRWAWPLHGTEQDEPPIMEQTGNTSHVKQGCAYSMGRYAQKYTQTSTRLNLTVSTDCRLQNNHSEVSVLLTNMPPPTHSYVLNSTTPLHYANHQVHAHLFRVVLAAETTAGMWLLTWHTLRRTHRHTEGDRSGKWQLRQEVSIYCTHDSFHFKLHMHESLTHSI